MPKLKASPIIILITLWSCFTAIAGSDVTSAISEILDRLTNKTLYDKRLRPRYGSDPVDVGITIHVSSISAVSEVDMDFTLDFYMRQTWVDPRLAFADFDLGLGDKKIEFLTVGVDYLNKLWKPDTFFPNEKKSFFHTATTHNSFLRIEADGTVRTSQRLTVTATCPMKLQLFPMDSQKCRLEVESYGYTTADIDYYWGKAKGAERKGAVAFETFILPQFRQSFYQVNATKAVTSSGTYVRLYFEVLFMRNMGFYSMNIVIPSLLIVTMSWVSFWLQPEASPARVSLGVTTVLTMTTLITTTNNSMPKVSYIKALDVFLSFSFITVFGSLIEYAAVSYANRRYSPGKTERRRRRREEKKKKRRTEVPAILSIPIECDCATIPLIQHPRFVPDAALALLAVPPTNNPWPAPFGRAKKARLKCKCKLTAAKIDRFSRCVFPILFYGFNLIYWSIMSWISSKNDNLNELEWFPITTAPQ